jgi:hypothetical protein
MARGAEPMTDADDADLRRRAERRADAKLAFRSHLAVYVLVNLGLFAINLITSPGSWWFYWATLGWGIGLVAHGAATYSLLGGERERMFEQELKRVRDRG